MKIRHLLPLLLSSVSLLGCSDKGDGGTKELKLIEIAEIGVTISAPSDWKLTKSMDRYYGLASPDGTQVQIIGSILSGGDSLEELAKECRETVLEKEMLPGGAFYVLCKGKQAGRDTKAVKVNVSTGEKSSVRCQWETDADSSMIATVCKTLKKI